MRTRAVIRTFLAVTLVGVLSACGRSGETPATPAGAGVPQPTSPSLSVEGSGFVLRLPDGSVLRGRELEGTTIHLSDGTGGSLPLRLTAITPDPDHADLLRHAFETLNAQGQWVPACDPNAYGERWGFPVALPAGHPGYEREITMTCASGAVGKCARFGYKPWAKGADGEDLLPLHAACVRMVRADYCGDGQGHTKDGTEIDIYDDLRIQEPGAKAGDGFEFEAGWSAEGAVCVHHTRWPDLVTKESLLQSCPRLASVPACDESRARALGARLFNASRRNAS